MPAPDRYFNLDDSTFDVTRDFDPSKWADELITGSDIDDAAKETLRAVLAKPTVASRLKNSVALRSEAQRGMDKARDLIRTAEQVRDDNYDWRAKNQAALEAAAGRGRGNGNGDDRGDRGGNGNGGNGNGRGDGDRGRIELPEGVLTKAELAAVLKERDEAWGLKLSELDQSYTGLLAVSNSLARDYSSKFNDVLPYDELQEFAVKNKLSLANAYPRYIQPKLDELRAKEIDRIKTEAYEKGRIDALSSREEPGLGEAGGDLGSAFKDVLLGRRTQTVNGADGKALEGEDKFVANWNKTHGFTRSDTVA
jgi:hypothetical protein